MPLLHQGGVEVLVRTLIEDSPAGDEVVLISQDATIDLARCGLMGRIRAHLRVPDGVLEATWGWTMAEWITEQKVDLCHFHLGGTYGWRAGCWSGCPITILAESGLPVVCTNHQAVTYFDRSRPPSPFWRKCAGTLRCWPGKVRQLQAVRWEALVSQHDLAISRRSFPGLGHKMNQIYHSRLDANLSTNTGERERSILNVATIAFRKGQHILAEAFARIAPDFPDWNLDLVGYKAEQACVDAIESIRREKYLGDRIRFHGPHQDPSPFYLSAGIYVQPSLLEGLGLSLQEAMFHGIPSVGSDCGGIPELLTDSSIGRLFRSGDVSSLAEILSNLIADESLRRPLGAAGRQSILSRDMTRQSMSASYRNLYQKTLHHL